MTITNMKTKTKPKRKKRPDKKRRFWGPILALVLALTAFSPSAADGAFNWYVKNNDTHTVPELPGEFSFLADHAGYYVNPAADESDRVIYLTFDAGYENGNVAKILDALEAHGAAGTFFVLENLIRREPDLIRRMAASGQTVANHTCHHPDMTRLTDRAAFEAELAGLEKAFFDCTGQKIAPFYRPPEGRFSEANLDMARELGYATVFWSFAYADWDNDRQMTPDAAFEKIMAHTHNGMVILLHPTSATNAALMDRLLTAWEAEGYRFGSLDEFAAA